MSKTMQGTDPEKKMRTPALVEMNTNEFIDYLCDADIRILVKDGCLRCNAPEGALSAEMKAELVRRKEEIIARLKTRPRETLNSDTILKAPHHGHIPLTFAQQRLWFLHRLDPQNPAYNITASRFFEGRIDLKVLEQSIDLLFERHEILRTIFPERDGVPVQVVTKQKPDLALVDLTHIPIESRHDQFVKWRQEEAQKPFSVETPMVRISLVCLSEQEHHLTIVMHHIISDGWSLGIFFRQLGEIYQKVLSGDTVQLHLPVQYADFAWWQHESFNNKNTQKHIDYWKQKLNGVLPVLDLPTDRPREAKQGSRGAIQDFKFSTRLSSGLKKLSRKADATLYMTLLAIFKILLHRYTAQIDIVVGTPIASRNRSELETLIGLFVNTLVLRTDLGGSPNVIELIARIREVVLEAHEHQEYPFEKIVELVQPDRSLSYGPIFQVVLAFQNTPDSLTYESVSAGAMFDLSLFFWENEKNITGSIEYNSDLFDSDTIARMIGHLKTLAEGVVEQPDRSISRLPILTPAEQAQFDTWNRTVTNYPRNKTIHELFDAQATETPDSIALITSGDDRHPDFNEMTYRVLKEETDSLASYLRNLGVKPGDCVGLALNRTPELIVAILAVLKAGGAYVPIDLSYPEERLIYMMQDADIRLLLTTAEHKKRLPSLEAQTLCIDRESIPSDPGYASVDSDRSDNLAYIMYTSGSTGDPKGVCVTHRNVVRLVKNTNYINLSPQEVFLACAPISFDASTLEIWGSLLNGGRLVLYTENIPSPDGIAKCIHEHDVTTLWLTSGLFNLVVETHPECFNKVRQLLTGGDVLSPVHVKNAVKALHNGVLVNGYGPTENTTFTTCYRIDPGTLDSLPNILIGRPIANTQVYVLDENMLHVPIGVRGELWTGGDGVATGYLNSEELTRQKFVPDSFKDSEGGKLYRTGDFVRFKPDGNIEFLGRIDNQVKIRGFRIEPGEIETILGKHPSVQKVSVIVKGKDSGKKYLTAYLIPSKDDSLSADDLKSFALDRLPSYMVPNFFIVLDKFPLTINGKIDYARLPDPVEQKERIELPKTPLQTQLLTIWENLLGVSGIGLSDNFFDLGGHSLLALRLINQMEKVFNKKFPISTIFQTQTIEELATAMMNDSLEFGGILIAINPEGTKPPLFVIPGVGGSALGYAELARLMGDDQPMYCLQSPGLDGMQTPLENIDDIGHLFVQEIRKKQPNGPYTLVGFCMGGAIAYEVAQLLSSKGQDIDNLVLIDTFPPTYLRGTKSKRLNTSLHIRFVIAGIARNFGSFFKDSPKSWISKFKQKVSIIKQIVETRDLYRGDRSQMYRDLVQQANFKAFSEYLPKPYNGEIWLVITTDRDVNKCEDPRLYWGTLAIQGYRVKQIPGKDSGALLRKPNVHQLVDVLIDCFSSSKSVL